MNIYRQLLSDFVYAILAGLAISIGAIAFLSCESKIVGALFFCVGLFVIVNFKFNLFTGKVCYALENRPVYLLRLLVIWLGNFGGTFVTATCVGATRLVSSLQEKCVVLAETKLADNLFSIFILAVLCNLLIYLAVEGFNSFNSPLTKVLALFFGVSVFVVCGFEHCVANMFYFSFAKVLSAKTFLYLLVMTAGNSVGGLLIPFVKKFVPTK